MKFELKHPWWTHAPALCLAAVATIAAAMTEMPAKVPIHFGLNGKADGWGSPLELRIVLIALPLFILTVSFVIDELYCKFEQRKQFNFLALFDEGLIGFVLGLNLATISAISSGSNILDGEMVKLGVEIAMASMAMAAVLEYLRKPRLSQTAQAGGTQPLSANELEDMGDGKRWMHWETQNPLYLRLLMIFILAIPLPMFLDKRCPLWILLLMSCLIFPVFILFYGGMRISVTPELLTVRFGLFGLPLLKTPLGDIVSAQAASFNPIEELGGWGIRYSSEHGWIYLLYGSRGVKLKTSAGKSYVIGSDDADRLAAICQTALRSSGKA